MPGTTPHSGIINCHPDPRDQRKPARLRRVLVLLGVVAIIIAYWILVEI